MHTQLLNQWVPRRFPERRKGVAPQSLRGRILRTGCKRRE